MEADVVEKEVSFVDREKGHPAESSGTWISSFYNYSIIAALNLYASSGGEIAEMLAVSREGQRVILNK